MEKTEITIMEMDAEEAYRLEQDPFWQMWTPEDIRRSMGTETAVFKIKCRFPLP